MIDSHKRHPSALLLPTVLPSAPGAPRVSVWPSQHRGPWQWRFADDEVKTVAAEHGARWFQVQCGRVWLTQSLRRGVAVDHWLQAGEQLFLPAGTTWVAQGIQGARVALLQAPPQPAGITGFLGGRGFAAGLVRALALTFGAALALPR